MAELVVAEWITIAIAYFWVGILFAMVSVQKQWEIAMDFTYIPLWPFYLFLWLPMIIFIGFGMIIYGIGKILIMDNINPRIRMKVREVKYRRQVKKYRPKYGYDK